MVHTFQLPSAGKVAVIAEAEALMSRGRSALVTFSDARLQDVQRQRS